MAQLTFDIYSMCLQFLYDQGYSVAIITALDLSNKSDSIRQLEAAGYGTLCSEDAA